MVARATVASARMADKHLFPGLTAGSLTEPSVFSPIFQLSKDLSAVLEREKSKVIVPAGRASGVGATKDDTTNTLNAAVTTATFHHKDSSVTTYRPPPVFDAGAPAGLANSSSVGPTPSAGETTIVKVTSPTLTRSFGSFLNTINKSVSSALNSIMSFQQPGQDFSTGLRPEHAAQPPKVGRGNGAAATSTSTPTITSTTSAPEVAPPVSRMATTAAVVPPCPSPLPTPSTRMPASPSFTHTRPRSRSPSPRGDVGFASAVTNLCDQAHEIAQRERRSGSFRRKGE